MIRQRPEILAYWMLKNNSAGHALMTNYDIRPTYFIYQLYKQFGNHLLAASSDGPMVSVFAARRDDGTVTVMIVNRAPDPVRKRLQLGNGSGFTLSEAYLFDQDHLKAAEVQPPAFKNGDTVEFGGRSVVLYIFKP